MVAAIEVVERLVEKSGGLYVNGGRSLLKLNPPNGKSIGLFVTKVFDGVEGDEEKNEI